jgi:hypothetical protein
MSVVMLPRAPGFRRKTTPVSGWCRLSSISTLDLPKQKVGYNMGVLPLLGRNRYGGDVEITE